MRTIDTFTISNLQGKTATESVEILHSFAKQTAHIIMEQNSAIIALEAKVKTLESRTRAH